MRTRKHSQSNKTSDLPNGVSRIEEIDKRSPNAKARVCFNVLVKVDGESRIKKFRTSAKATEGIAKLTAIRFREYYEECLENGRKFDHHYFDDWNE